MRSCIIDLCFGALHRLYCFTARQWRIEYKGLTIKQMYIQTFKLTTLCRGPVRGGSGGSIDPPRILENRIKELKTELFSWIFGILTPLCVIPSILTPLSEIPNRASAHVFKNAKSWVMISQLAEDLAKISVSLLFISWGVLIVYLKRPEMNFYQPEHLLLKTPNLDS